MDPGGSPAQQRGDLVFGGGPTQAGPDIGIVGPEPAVNILYRTRLAESADPVAERAQLTAEYAERFANPYIAAARGYVDDVIDPRDTRTKVIHSFEMLRSKCESTPAKKHSNLPL